MDLSELTPDERLVAWSALAVLIGGLGATLSYTTYGGAWLAVVAALGALGILFLPPVVPGARLPWSATSGLLVAGGIAATALTLVLVVNVRFVFTRFTVADLLFLLAVAGGIGMTWAAWRLRVGLPAAELARDPSRHDDG